MFWGVLFNGGYGVFIFFEISGFLITSLLLKEYEKRGSISLTGFYIRRVFRILPPLYVYIGVVVALAAAGFFRLTVLDVASAAFFFRNIAGSGWPLEHLWSVTIEEQFYLVWPWILVLALGTALTLGTPSERNRYRACIFPVLVILLSPPIRFLLYCTGNPAFVPIYRGVFRFDFIMFGCLVAMLQNTPRLESVYRACTRIWWLPPLVIAVCSFLSTRFGNYFDLTIGFTTNGFAIAIFLLWCTRNPASIVGRILNSWPLVKIGVLSYSIYLWQTLFLHHNNERIFAFAPFLGRFPTNWLCIFLVAFASYNLVEQPALRLRDLLMRKIHVYRQNRIPQL